MSKMLDLDITRNYVAYRKEIQFWKNYTSHKCYFHCLNVTEVMDGDGQFHTLVPVAKDKRWFGLNRVRKTVTHLLYNSTAFFTTHPFKNCIAANAGVSFFAAPAAKYDGYNNCHRKHASG